MPHKVAARQRQRQLRQTYWSWTRSILSCCRWHCAYAPWHIWLPCINNIMLSICHSLCRTPKTQRNRSLSRRAIVAHIFYTLSKLTAVRNICIFVGQGREAGAKSGLYSSWFWAWLIPGPVAALWHLFTISIWHNLSLAGCHLMAC